VAMVEGLLGELLPKPPPRKLAAKHKHTEAMYTSAGKRPKEDPLAKKVDVLTVAFAQIKSLLMKLQLGEKLVSSHEAPTLESPILEEDVIQFYESEGDEVTSEIQSQGSYDPRMLIRGLQKAHSQSR
ncbi:hypothetical protein M9458_042907, partial [Cirrhinus mrigala]